MHALDGSRRLVHVHLDGVRLAADRVLGDGAGDYRVVVGPSRRHRRARVETVGTAQTIFDITLEYAKQRVQFGVPIGSFQAIKHKFADMLIALERARSTGYFAALTIAEDDGRRTTGASRSPRPPPGDCQRLLAKEGIQIHGGIGYTWEHDMHLYVRRVKSSALLFGTPRSTAPASPGLIGSSRSLSSAR